EIKCRMQYRRRALTGKAYLEGDDILFRGEERLKIYRQGAVSATSCPPPPRGVWDLLPLVCPMTGPLPVFVYVVKFIAGLAGDPFSHGTADSEHPPQPVRWDPSVGVVRLGDAHPLLHRPHHPLHLRPAPLRHHPHLFQAQEEEDHRTGEALRTPASRHHSTAPSSITPAPIATGSKRARCRKASRPPPVNSWPSSTPISSPPPTSSRAPYTTSPTPPPAWGRPRGPT